MPRSIDIELTTRCNLLCVMCQHTYWKRPPLDMPLSMFQNILQDIPSLSSVKLHGVGEPLLNPQLVDMIYLAKQKDLFVWTYTNGTLLHVDRQIDRLLDSGIDLLRISMDAADKATYECIRVGSRWEQVVENVKLLIKRRKELGSNTQVELWMVGMHSNIDQACSMVELGVKLGVDAVRIQMVANTYSYKPEVGQLLTSIPITKEDLADRHLQTAAEQARRLKILFEAETGKQYTEHNKCPWPFSRSFISAEGWVVPCGSIADPNTISFGSVAHKEFQAIWENEAYRRFRESHLLFKIPSFCSRCYSMMTGI